MWWTRRAHPRPKLQNADNRRRHQRYRSGHQLTCPLGTLENLTPGGMCVLSKVKPQVQLRQTLDLKIQGNSQKLRVQGRIVRISRTGFRRYEIGVAFLGVKASIAKALESFARFGYVDFTSNLSSSSGESAAESDPKQNENEEIPTTASVNILVFDPYEALGVPNDAPFDVIHQAYRQLARQYHPDVSTDQNAPDRFKEINESYEILKDPERRRIYDHRQTG